MWLQHQGKYDCIAEFNPKDGSLIRHSRNEMGNTAPEIMIIDGWFSDMKDGVFILYKHKGKIFFRAYEDEFALDKKTVVEVHGPREKRKLIVKLGEQAIFETEYALTQSKPIPGDPTPFIRDEDYDFGLFVSNISRSAQRKKVLLMR